MNSAILVYGLASGLVVLLIARFSATRAVYRYILEWMKVPGSDRFDPWRCRLGVIVLLFPAVAIIFDIGLPGVRSLDSVGGGPERGSRGWFVINGLESMRESVWLGLLAYAVLRSPQAGVGKLTGLVLGYWIGAYLILKGLSRRSFSAEALEVLAIELQFYLAVGLVMSLIAGLFWLVTRATRARLLAPGEINESAGLGLRDVLWIITGFGVTISGVQIFCFGAARIDETFELRVETMLLLFLQLGFVGMMLLVTVFLARNNRQRMVSVLLMAGLVVLDLVIPRVFFQTSGDVDPGGWRTEDPLPLLVLDRLTHLGLVIVWLSVLRWLWHKMDWSISMGRQVN